MDVCPGGVLRKLITEMQANISQFSPALLCRCLCLCLIVALAWTMCLRTSWSFAGPAVNDAQSSGTHAGKNLPPSLRHPLLSPLHALVSLSAPISCVVNTQVPSLHLSLLLIHLLPLHSRCRLQQRRPSAQMLQIHGEWIGGSFFSKALQYIRPSLSVW